MEAIFIVFAILTIIAFIIGDAIAKRRRRSSLKHIEWANKIRVEMLYLASDLEVSQKDGIEYFLTDCEKESFKSKTDRLMHKTAFLSDTNNDRLLSEIEGQELLAKINTVRDDWRELVESKCSKIEWRKYQERLAEAASLRKDNVLEKKAAALIESERGLKDCIAAGQELEKSLAQH